MRVNDREGVREGRGSLASEQGRDCASREEDGREPSRMSHVAMHTRNDSPSVTRPEVRGVRQYCAPMLKLLLFVLPLGLDTFAVSAALGTSGIQKRERLRISLLLSAFEMTMPVVGLLLGSGLGSAIGGVADYIAIVVLAGVGVYMLVSSEEGEAAQVAELSSRRGVALIALGVSISLDELAMGFTIGLIGLSIWLAVLLIGLQAFAVAQIGLRLGSHMSARYREAAEKLAGVALVGLAILLLVEKIG